MRRIAQGWVLLGLLALMASCLFACQKTRSETPSELVGKRMVREQLEARHRSPMDIPGWYRKLLDVSSRLSAKKSQGSASRMVRGFW